MSLDIDPTINDAKEAARAAVPSLVARSASGAIGQGDPAYLGGGNVTPEVRDAILRSLYDERAALLRKRREALSFSQEDASQLAELEAYIDAWEADDDEDQAADLWRQIDELAARVLTTARR